MEKGDHMKFRRLEPLKLAKFLSTVTVVENASL